MLVWLKLMCQFVTFVVEGEQSLEEGQQLRERQRKFDQLYKSNNTHNHAVHSERRQDVGIISIFFLIGMCFRETTLLMLQDVID